ncbi:MAG: sialate O-acetylesterase [Verrucomicrobiales bacterium]|nr:sialate O-acetylesterase [Verrucomicrobiales bacterium]
MLDHTSDRIRRSHRLPTVVALSLGLGIASLAARAEVRLHPLFADNMVLQQGKPVPVWGWADAGEEVTVSFLKQSAATRAGADGKWRVHLKSLKAGGPFTFKVTGENEIVLTNVLVGEVWICSGQSNMEWPLSRSYESADDIANSTNPQLRLFQVPKLKADEPVAEVKATWQLSGPDTVPGFSAVGYYFGRALQAARQVPVGMIHTSWGGSPAEVWMSQQALEASAEYRSDIVGKYETDKARYEEAVAKWTDAKAKAEAEGQTFNQRRPGAPWKPTELYNGMIAPLLPCAIKGAIWYQGESNAGRAWQYRRLFADMIQNWRRDFGQGNFPFLAVQLAPWDKNRKRSLEEITAEPVDSDWPELREAQDIAARTLPNVGIAVITDVGDKDDIHPTRKIPVGERLAKAACAIAYGGKETGLSPTYRKVAFEDGKAEVSFNHVKGALKCEGDKLTGFAIAGADRKFVWANAKIDGKEVEVWSDAVPEPVAVRFGWADYPVVNLFSAQGLPVSPFRTDDWPMVTNPND